jgi:hypothetical protein
MLEVTDIYYISFIYKSSRFSYSSLSMLRRKQVLLAAFLFINFVTAIASAQAQTTILKKQTYPFGLISPTMDPAIKNQITGDLDFITGIIFSKTSILHQKIFGVSKTNPYRAWLFKRIKTISVGNCANNDAAVACVIPILEQNKLRITQRYLEMDAPQVARASVVFHEARHTEPNFPDHERLPGEFDHRYWFHENCPVAFLDEHNKERVSIWTGVTLAGRDGCDSSAEGSYGVAIAMLKNISVYSTNTTEKVRADAEMYANDQRARIIIPAAYQQSLNDQ